MTSLITVQVRREADIVAARQRARQIAALMGFDLQDQARIATAVSEIVRNALIYAGGGRATIAVHPGPEQTELAIEIADQGPGIDRLDDVLAGHYRSGTGLGLGLVGAQRLVDAFDIQSQPGRGTRVRLAKVLPRTAATVDASRLRSIVAALARDTTTDPFGELNAQHQELLRALAELRERQEDLERLNHELADTNRGVVALYAELDERAESLKRADHTKSLFLSSVSHELRTPLNSIRSLAQLLADRVDGPLTEEQERQIRFIRKAADDLRQMVDDLLDLAKIEAGKADVRVEAVHLANVWSALRGMMRPLLTNPDVALVFDDPPAVTLLTDEAKLAQILRNLVSNALKYTERGEVRISAHRDGDRLAVRVQDTGIGIAPQDQATVFRDFVQIDSPLQRRHKGTGLGLPLCRRLAALLGGAIALRSAPGHGSTFTLTLPLQPDGEQPMPHHTADVSAALAGSADAAHSAARVVLLVDDNEQYRYLVRRALADAFEVHEAGDGAEGLSKALRLRPDAVVIDLSMPVMSGTEMLARLRAAAPSDATVAIVLSAQVLSDAERTELEALGAAIVRKDDQALLHVMQRLSP